MFFAFEFACKILYQRKFTIKKQNNEYPFKFLVLLCKFLLIFFLIFSILFCVCFDFSVLVIIYLFFTSKFACRTLCQRKFTIKKQNNGHPFKLLVLLCKFLLIFFFFFFMFSIFELFCVCFDFQFWLLFICECVDFFN